MDKLKEIWGNASNLGRVVIVGTAVLIVVVVIGAAAGESESGDDGDGAQVVAEEVDRGSAGDESRVDREAFDQGEKIAERDQPRREQTEEPAPSPSAEERAREALGDEISSDVAVGDSQVRSVKVTGQLMDITLATPEGGFEGPSTDDVDGLASAALARIYEDADWHGAAFVEFRGGLVDSATGRELPNAPTASYRVERRRAEQIDWSDEEVLFVIDWSIYRGLCHPALKGC